MSEETGNAGNNEGNNEGGEGKAITFASSEELQTHIDRTLSTRYAEINTKAEAKASETITTLQGEIASLKAGKDEGKKKESTADYTAMQDEITQLKEREQQSWDRNKKADILTIAADLGAVNGEQVAQLVSPNVKVAEDGTFSVLNAQGQVLYSADSKPTTVREYVTSFLNDNPHLVKSSGGTGAGSQGAGPSGASGGVKFNTPEDVKNMSKEDFDKAIADGIDIPVSGGRSISFKTNANMFASK